MKGLTFKLVRGVKQFTIIRSNIAMNAPEKWSNEHTITHRT